MYSFIYYVIIIIFYIHIYIRPTELWAISAVTTVYIAKK